MGRHFDASQRITIADSSDIRLVGSSMTVAAWTYYDGTIGGSLFPRIISKLSAPTYNGWELLQYNDGRYYVQLGTSGSLATCFTTAAVSANAWHHIVGSYNATTGDIAIYVDGALNNSSTITAGLIGSSTIDAQIGDYAGGTGGVGAWEGDIAEVGLWNRAFTVDQACGLYDGGSRLGRLRNGGLLYCPLVRTIRDEWKQRTLTDVSTSQGYHPPVNRPRRTIRRRAIAVIPSTPTDFRVGADHSADAFSQWKLSP